MNLKEFFAPKIGIILGGLLFGTLGALAVNWGNPPNMGICAGCFLRDIAGALQLHQNPLAQYIRPEVIGFVLGAFGSSLAFLKGHSQGGSSPLLRFLLGAFVMIGVLVFLGCPIRVMLRLAGGDLSGLLALVGLVTGIGIGVYFLKRGFSLGHVSPQPLFFGLMMPIMAVVLLLLLVTKPTFIAFSQTGLGAQHLPWLLGLGLGLLVGVVLQKTRFCSIGAWRDIFLVRDFHLFSGVAAFLMAALLTNYLAGNFSPQGLGYHWGFTHQPIALPMNHWTEYLWSFLSLMLVGLAGTLLDGCPMRNLIRSGEGDTDAAVTVLGYLAGAALANNFQLASSPNGLTSLGPVAVAAGLIFCVAVALIKLERTEPQTPSKAVAFVGDSLITFSDVSSAMKAEKVIKSAGYDVKLVAPPKEMRFKYLIDNVAQLSPKVLTLHYCLPIMGLLKKLCEAIKACPQRPFLIADAGAMYAAKGAGLANEFDIFTPDSSEIAFLADKEATHPAYISHHLFAADADAIPDQIMTAFTLKSAAKLLLVKGKTDYIACDGRILKTIHEPDIPTLEAIGGTGDTITGLVSAFVYAGFAPLDAALNACRTNRLAGQLVQPTPATKVRQVIDQFPSVVERYYAQRTTKLLATQAL